MKLDTPLIDKFQSTPSQRGRLVTVSADAVAGDISIHALAKRATAPIVGLFSARLFQSTPSQRGRLNPAGAITSLGDFNPRPRKEGDLT